MSGSRLARIALYAKQTSKLLLSPVQFLDKSYKRAFRIHQLIKTFQEVDLRLLSVDNTKTLLKMMTMMTMMILLSCLKNLLSYLDTW
jgi:hypothetical protein